MEGVVEAFGIHAFNEQTYRAHHDAGVAGLDGDDHVAEAMALADAEKFQAALDDALWRVAVAAHDAVGKRAVVDPDADGGVVFLADLQERGEALLEFAELFGVLWLGVDDFAEGAGGIDIVARIDTYFFNGAGGHVGHVGVEMDIGHQRCVAALGVESLADVFQVLSLADALCGETHIVGSGAYDADALLHAGLGVGGWRGCHALQAYGVGAAEGRFPYLYDG